MERLEDKIKTVNFLKIVKDNTEKIFVEFSLESGRRIISTPYINIEPFFLKNRSETDTIRMWKGPEWLNLYRPGDQIEYCTDLSKIENNTIFLIHKGDFGVTDGDIKNRTLENMQVIKEKSLIENEEDTFIVSSNIPNERLLKEYGTTSNSEPAQFNNTKNKEELYSTKKVNLIDRLIKDGYTRGETFEKHENNEFISTNDFVITPFRCGNNIKLLIETYYTHFADHATALIKSELYSTRPDKIEEDSSMDSETFDYINHMRDRLGLTDPPKVIQLEYLTRQEKERKKSIFEKGIDLLNRARGKEQEVPQKDVYEKAFDLYVPN